MKFNIKINAECENEHQAQVIGQLLQNIADNTDKDTIYFLHKKISQKPDYFQKIASKLKNPMIQKMIG